MYFDKLMHEAGFVVIAEIVIRNLQPTWWGKVTVIHVPVADVGEEPRGPPPPFPVLG